MFTTLIFDMDGLMIDSEGMYWSAARDIARSFGKLVSDRTLGDMMGRSPIESMEVFRRDLAIGTPAADLLAMRTTQMRKLLEEVEPMPGLMSLLDEFAGRLRYAIATSAQREFVDIVMRRLAIANRFAAIQSSDGISHGKPHPEIYQKTMSWLGAPPDECAVLEDSSNGALAAKRAGTYVIAVPSQCTKDQEFGFVDFRAADLAHAAQHLGELIAT